MTGFMGIYCHMAVCQNLVPLVNIKIAGKWMFIPLKMVLIGIDPYPYALATLKKPLGRSRVALGCPNCCSTKFICGP